MFAIKYVCNRLQTIFEKVLSISTTKNCVNSIKATDNILNRARLK
jgi:hypothetical protein